MNSLLINLVIIMNHQRFAPAVLIFMKFHKGKGKTVALQGWTGPEGSRRLRLPDFKTVDT